MFFPGISALIVRRFISKEHLKDSDHSYHKLHSAFGEEFGWRGYSLPKLLPLERKKALIISSIIWGLWHLRLLYFFLTPGIILKKLN
ncbi:CPBP family intramembrane glutamic endopeptidase [Methanosarcina barkeri]|uniref:CPBP family intramembrane glutamic endopeptidase n=1 Tax=Methanosarcina barkeri TaxID=2208 RepID=UPI00064FDC85